MQYYQTKMNEKTIQGKTNFTFILSYSVPLRSKPR